MIGAVLSRGNFEKIEKYWRGRLWRCGGGIGVDDIGLENVKESPGPYPAKNSPLDCFIKWVRVLCHQKRNPHRMVWISFLVDDIGLEPMTFRTSSGCSSQLS